MKQALLTLAIVIFAATAASAGADKVEIKPEIFENYCSFGESLNSGKFYRSRITEDIVIRSHGNLRDLRLFNSQGEETQYVILENKSPHLTITSVAKIRIIMVDPHVL